MTYHSRMLNIPSLDTQGHLRLLSQVVPVEPANSPDLCRHIPELRLVLSAPGEFPLKGYCKGCSRTIVRDALETGWRVVPIRETPKLESGIYYSVPGRREP